MEELLEKINQTFDNCIENSTEDTKLQLRILKGNINTLFQEYRGSSITTDIQKTSLEPAPTSEKPIIYVVDDSSIVRNYLEKLLRNHYQVIPIQDGQEAIQMLQENQSQNKNRGMLLDLMMPNIDGFGVLKYMSENNIQIPVIVISGDNTKETINKAFEYNVVDVIEKPFDSKTIETKISNILPKE